MTKGTMWWVSGAMLVAACQRESAPAPAAVPHAAPKAAAAALKPGPTPQELTVGMVEAVTVGKAALPLTIKFDLPHRPSVGQPFDIVVALIPHVAGGAVTVLPVAGDGLSLAASPGPIEIQSPEPTQVYRLTIPVTPTAEGVHFLGLKVSLKEDDVLEMGTFSVPVIVAAAGEAVASGAPAASAASVPPAH